MSQVNLHIQFRQCTFSPGHVSHQPGLIILSNVVYVVINYGIRQNIQERNFVVGVVNDCSRESVHGSTFF